MRSVATSSVRYSKSIVRGQKHPREVVEYRNRIPTISQYITACTWRPTKLLWKKGGWSCPCITIWKLVPALTTQQIIPYMNLTRPQEIWIFLNQMEKVASLDHHPTYWSQGRESSDLCRLMQKWSGPWRYQAFHLEHMSMIQRNTTSLSQWVNIWSLEKRLRPNSESIMMHKDYQATVALTEMKEWIN